MTIQEYENPEYWAKRSNEQGVGTLGWSPKLNAYLYERKRALLARHLKAVPQGGWVLDIGCGVGLMGAYIKSVRPDLHLIGADFCRPMLERAAITQAYELLMVANVTRMPFADRRFDLVLAMDVLFHVVQPENKGHAWLELGRVAKRDDGLLAYTNSHEVTTLISIERLAHSLCPRIFGRALRDRLTLWLTRVCDRASRLDGHA